MGKIERVEDIAIDGKTIRSSSVGLMAALVHKDGTVVAQKRLDGPKVHEIPAAHTLLEPLDLSEVFRLIWCSMPKQASASSWARLPKGPSAALKPWAFSVSNGMANSSMP